MLKIDRRAAVSELEELADKGSVASMLYLGWSYSAIAGGIDNATLAEAWLRRAAEHGSLLARFYLGSIYRKAGQLKAAVAEYTLCVAGEYMPALYRLGVMYYRGEGVIKDVDMARELWVRAASGGHIYARRNLALMLMSGRSGIKRIPDGIRAWLGATLDFFVAIRTVPKSDLLR
jgi:TPR repeat protein